MTTFTILTEAIAAKNFGVASKLIQTYLRKNLGTQHVYLFPEPEHFKSSNGTGVGIRYFLNQRESIRFNWLSDGSISDSKNLISVDYWDGNGPGNKPTKHLKFDIAQSLVKSLPVVVEFLKNTSKTEFLWVEESKSLIESALENMTSTFTMVEAKGTSNDVIPTISNVIHAYSQGRQMKDMHNDDSIGFGYYKVIGAMRDLYPDFFEKKGNAVYFTSKANAGKIDIEKVKAKLKVGGVSAKVSAGSVETIIASKEVQAMEDNLPRLAYEEQLEDLRRAMVLLMNNATNAMFLAGRGGVGKTQTVEEELHKRGLEDGNGYFKITGSASTAGIYRTLYEHRKDILLFDDSDGALADQDSRNLFKAASDTKKVRKIAWMKGGKSYVDPADLDDEDETDDRLPRYFDFTGKIIFISNLKLNKLDPDGALQTRAFVVNIDPTDSEVYDYMEKIVDKIKLDVDYQLTSAQRKEVVELLRARKGKDGTVNLRSLVRGLNTMAGILAGGGNDYAPMIIRYA